MSESKAKLKKIAENEDNPLKDLGGLPQSIEKTERKAPVVRNISVAPNIEMTFEQEISILLAKHNKIAVGFYPIHDIAQLVHIAMTSPRNVTDYTFSVKYIDRTAVQE